MTRYILFAIGLLAGCQVLGNGQEGSASAQPKKLQSSEVPADAKVATFAGGCFWCVEAAFEKVDGVYSAVSGFSGGKVANPTYKQVSSGRTDHTESVEVRFDPKRVSYEDLLYVFWRQIDPTDAGGQFADRGSEYRTAIFYHDADQQRLAGESKRSIAKAGGFERPIVTEILPASAFYAAEEYHQDFYKKNKRHYQRYRMGSGRDGFLKKKWGTSYSLPRSARAPRKDSYVKPNRENLEEKLTPLQFKVTQEDGTEPPFRNTYWNNKKEGIYVDVVTGEPLFSSIDKFESGTGWPSFTRPLDSENVTEKSDSTLGMVRTEVRSKHGDSHLGHLFEDGPKPTGLRYCINSAALRFIPKDELEKEGYGTYSRLFENR